MINTVCIKTVLFLVSIGLGPAIHSFDKIRRTDEYAGVLTSRVFPQDEFSLHVSKNAQVKISIISSKGSIYRSAWGALDVIEGIR